MKEPRIGIFVCHCGLNIGGVVNVPEVVEYAKTLPNVVYAEHYVYMCSEPGQNLIKNAIKDYKLNRVIVAACSPSMHEITFRHVCEEAGLNPYLFEMVNIREHCSWVHSHWPKEATEKAKDLVRMAAARARFLKPLNPMEVKIEPSALVIGGGVTGLTAAINLADRGFNVYLIEKKPFLGGIATQLSKFSLNGKDSREILNPLMERVLNHKRIKVYLNSEVVEVGGYVGNFSVKIKRNPRYINENCTECGKCVEICPINVLDEFNVNLIHRKAIYMPYPEAYPRIYAIDLNACNKCGKCTEICDVKAINLSEKSEILNFKVGVVIIAVGLEAYKPSKEYSFGEHPDIITQLQLERLLSTSGPTGGELLRPSNGKKPESVVFILCVGSRTNERPYCSRVCCSSSIKNAYEIKKRNPDVEVYVLYRDIRTYGKNEEYYTLAREIGVNFIRYSLDKLPKVVKDNEKLKVSVFDVGLNTTLEIPADLVILAEALIPRSDLSILASKFGISLGPDGFLKEAHPKLKPVETVVNGVFIAGGCQGPKSVSESVVQACAAAAKASILLAKGVIKVEPIVALVNEDKCIGCGTCIEVCPFKAVEKDEIGVAKINTALCKGCGVCAASCPEKAITVMHFTDEQITAQTIAAIREVIKT